MLSERRESLEDAANELVRRANKAGGQDNITVVAFELTDEPDEPDERRSSRRRADRSSGRVAAPGAEPEPSRSSAAQAAASSRS